MTRKLSAAMDVTQFNHGYWYATELKAFAKTIGIPRAGALRKDELEQALTRFLRTGAIEIRAAPPVSRSAIKDVDRGLRPGLRVVVYTNDTATKAFLEREALKLAPDLKRRSGARYRLNRWRERQIADGIAITYRDLVREYVRLSLTAGSFPHIPHGRYINFMSDFLSAEKGATRSQAVAAWKLLKTLNIPKDYRSWKNLRSSATRSVPAAAARESGAPAPGARGRARADTTRAPRPIVPAAGTDPPAPSAPDDSRRDRRARGSRR